MWFYRDCGMRPSSGQPASEPEGNIEVHAPDGLKTSLTRPGTDSESESDSELPCACFASELHDKRGPARELSRQLKLGYQLNFKNLKSNEGGRGPRS